MRIALLTLTFTLTLVTNAQNPDRYFVAIIANDMDASLLWYTETLGFDVLNQTENESRGFKQVNLKRGNGFLELIELNGTLSLQELLEGKKTRIEGFFKFGFSVPQFDQWINFLNRNNVTTHGQVVTDPVSNKRMIIILDPDGNRIQLFEE